MEGALAVEPIKPIKRPLNPQFARPIDGMIRVQKRAVPQPSPQVARPPVQPTITVKKTNSRFKDILQMSLVIILGIAAGLIFQFLPLGQVGVIIYGVIAIARRIPSFVTFIALLASFFCVGVLAALGNTGLITQNIATYAFFLFIIGVASAALELRRASKLSGNLHAKEALIQH